TRTARRDRSCSWGTLLRGHVYSRPAPGNLRSRLHAASLADGFVRLAEAHERVGVDGIGTARRGPVRDHLVSLLHGIHDLRIIFVLGPSHALLCKEGELLITDFQEDVATLLVGIAGDDGENVELLVCGAVGHKSIDLSARRILAFFFRRLANDVANGLAVLLIGQSLPIAISADRLRRCR